MKVLWLPLALFSIVLFQLSAQAQTPPDSPSMIATAAMPAPCGHGTGTQLTWDFIYPGTDAQYVGGTLPDMQMTKRSSLWTFGLSASQFRRGGRLALSSDCLLFAFDAKAADHFKNNTSYRVIACSDKIDFSQHKDCKRVSESEAHSYVIMVPYGKINTLSRAKYASADLTASATAFATFAGAVLTAIASSVHRVAAREQSLGGAAAAMSMFYYFGVARPRVQDNYIASFIELPIPQLSFSRSANEVTLTTPKPGYFRAGQKIEVAGVPAHKLTEISAISRDAKGEVTVTVKDARALPPKGSKVQIVHVSDPSFEGKFKVTSVERPDKLTYEQKDKGAAEAEPNRGEVQDVWNGTFTIDEIKNPNTLTYEQVGADDQASDQGSVGAADDPSTNVEVTGNLAPNDPDAKKTSKSVDLTGTVTVNPPAGKSDDLFKKGDLVIFRIPNFHDYYNISMILSSGTGLTFVNETTDKAGK